MKSTAFEKGAAQYEAERAAFACSHTTDLRLQHVAAMLDALLDLATLTDTILREEIRLRLQDRTAIVDAVRDEIARHGETGGRR